MIGTAYLSARRALLGSGARVVGSSLESLAVVSFVDQPQQPLLERRSFHTTTPVHQKKKTFRPRRRPAKDYRPIKAGRKKVLEPFRGNDNKFIKLTGNDEKKKAPFGPIAQDIIDGVRRERQRKLLNQFDYDDSVEEQMRMMDYFVAEDGSVEDRVGERRALAVDFDTDQEREEFKAKMDQMVRDGNLRDLGMDHDFEEKTDALELKAERKKEGKFPPFDEFKGDKDDEDFDDNPDTMMDPDQLAFGEWSEMLISVDRNVKLWRGGRLQSYRALVIGGNMNGCGGFGTGKSKEPIEAVAKASRMCKRNIYFVDPYQGDGITRDLVGKQNNCKVVIRQTHNGLRGNPLSMEILKRFGIVNAQIKAYGRRTPSNVVRGTFKALMSHESLEDIALKRGKRLISLDRAYRLGV